MRTAAQQVDRPIASDPHEPPGDSPACRIIGLSAIPGAEERVLQDLPCQLRVADDWKATGSAEIDTGRFEVTQDPADLYVFKVPSLRNVAMTAPYFHDGSVATLDEAVKVMGRVQLGIVLPDTEVAEITAFLGALTGPLPASFATAPALPPAFKRNGP